MPSVHLVRLWHTARPIRGRHRFLGSRTWLYAGRERRCRSGCWEEPGSIGLHLLDREQQGAPPAPLLTRCGPPVPHAGWRRRGRIPDGRDRIDRPWTPSRPGGTDRQLDLPDHDPPATRPRGLGPGWQVLPSAHTRLSERVDVRWELLEDGLGRPRLAPGVSRRGPVDHNVICARDRGRAIPNRTTVLADLARTRTYAM